YPVTPSGLTSSNYAITFKDGTLTVTPAALTVTADNASKVYGSANPAFTANYQGFVNGDASTSLGGALAFATSATSASDVGSYSVTPSGLTSGNYAITFQDGTLTITKADQIIAWNQPANIVAGTPLGASQLDAAVSVVGPAPAGALTYTPPAGTVLAAGNGQVLSVTAAATNDYNAATATVSINVLPRAQYHFHGFLTPLDDRQTFTAGQTIPIRFALTDAHGAPVTDLRAVASLQIAQVNSDGSLGAPFGPASSDGQGLRVDGRQFHFNWQTGGLASGAYEIVLTLSDGSVETKVVYLTAPHLGKPGNNSQAVGRSGASDKTAIAHDAVFQSLAEQDDEIGDG
ncbi:MAG TPA: MBG domain-containing protein, partial [Pirellulales bacterium]|nr:MBG domain-containing protein [Pirellulales bacterium]